MTLSTLSALADVVSIEDGRRFRSPVDSPERPGGRPDHRALDPKHRVGSRSETQLLSSKPVQANPSASDCSAAGAVPRFSAVGQRLRRARPGPSPRTALHPATLTEPAAAGSGPGRSPSRISAPANSTRCNEGPCRPTAVSPSAGSSVMVFPNHEFGLVSDLRPANPRLRR